MHTEVVTIQTNISDCTWDYRVDVIDHVAQLRYRRVIRDELGAVTSRTYELIKGDVCAKKVFVLDQAGTSAPAELIIRTNALDGDTRVPDGSQDGAILVIEVNGQRIEHRPMRRNRSFQREIDDYWSGGWEIVPIPPNALRVGTNEVILRDGGGTGWKLFVDNYPLSGHSSKSVDGGKTWTNWRLGLNDFCLGEYVVRLNLQCHTPEGTITSPFIDLAASAGDGEIAPKAKIKKVTLTPTAVVPDGTTMTYQWRSGVTPSYRPDTWGSWAPADRGVAVPEGHRFFQWQARMTTAF